MAEELTQETKEPSFNQEQMQQFIQQSVQNSFRDALQSQEEPVKQQETDPWADIINPHIQPKVQQAELRAAAAEDKSDFYSSDEWLVDVEDHFITEDSRKERKELREEVERLFTQQMKAGKPLPRKDILAYLLGNRVLSKKTEYQEAIVKKRTKQQDASLQKARQMQEFSSGNISNYEPQAIHAMTDEKLVETFGNMAF